MAYIVTVYYLNGSIARYTGVAECNLPSSKSPQYEIKMENATDYINKDTVRMIHCEVDTAEVQ